MTSLAIHGGKPEVPQGTLNEWPVVTDTEREAVLMALDVPAVDQGGPDSRIVRKFEDQVAEYMGARYCLGVASGTDALRVALVAVGVRPGHTVLLPSFGWPSAPLIVQDIGAKPVFVEIDPATWTIDVTRVAEAIDGKTRAIMPVHTHGLIADMEPLRALAARLGIAIVEDACQAPGARYQGQHPGSNGVAAYSLNVQKPLQGGAGGFIVTSDPGTWDAIHRYAELGDPRDGGAGRTTRRRGTHVRYRGITTRLHPMAAARAAAQLPRLDGYLRRARENAEILTDGLRALPGIVLAKIHDPHQTTHHLFRVKLDAQAWDDRPVGVRDRIMAALHAEGVPVDQWQISPLPKMPVFRRDNPLWEPGSADRSAVYEGGFPVAESLLECSFVIGRCPYPLHVQEPDTMRAYVRAFEKVWETLGPS